MLGLAAEGVEGGLARAPQLLRGCQLPNSPTPRNGANQSGWSMACVGQFLFFLKDFFGEGLMPGGALNQAVSMIHVENGDWIVYRSHP